MFRGFTLLWQSNRGEISPLSWRDFTFCSVTWSSLSHTMWRAVFLRLRFTSHASCVSSLPAALMNAALISGLEWKGIYLLNRKKIWSFLFRGGFVSKQMSDSLIIISTHVCMHELASAFLLSVTHECSTTVHVWMAYSAAFCHIAWCTANEPDWRVFICLCLQLYPINSQSVHFHYSGPCVRKAVFTPRLAKHPISNPQCGNVLINT